jgi:hypothetical protein
MMRMMMRHGRAEQREQVRVAGTLRFGEQAAGRVRETSPVAEATLMMIMMMRQGWQMPFLPTTELRTSLPSYRLLEKEETLPL